MSTDNMPDWERVTRDAVQEALGTIKPTKGQRIRAAFALEILTGASVEKDPYSIGYWARNAGCFFRPRGKCARCLEGWDDAEADLKAGEEAEPLTDPMHQLANLDKPLTIGETLPATFAPTVLSQIMRERHAAKTCGWGCPECQAEER